ncbi:hypothetical protein [Burkholderia vietnamiensis]|uniref:hypothetical protein n=1 Tax=Burkholderia vietnamiensis TaxID=60552 RepID=UPI000A6C32D8|nr:hypothetical protein [Burkholderia vietnamiensis]MBR8189219.1 hypothetical protein [Burkholderia vietnamiensis]HDR9174424.1 hypothetical protein [Burkholderia vietnamiensis]
MNGPLMVGKSTRIAYKHLSIGDAFEFERDGQVFVRCREGFRPSPDSKCDPERLVFPHDPHKAGPRVWVPDWAICTLIEHVRTVAEAMDRYYRPERLNRPGGTRERLIADREACIDEDGFAWLASHHDSVAGVALFIRPTGEAFSVYRESR